MKILNSNQYKNEWLYVRKEFDNLWKKYGKDTNLIMAFEDLESYNSELEQLLLHTFIRLKNI